MIAFFSKDTPSVCVVTPSIGSKHLKYAIISVNNQTYTNFEHLIVCDGSQYSNKVCDIMNEMRSYSFSNGLKLLELPYNTGKLKDEPFYGHRIYSAIASLIPHDIICFLDEDNYYLDNHIIDAVNLFKKNPELKFVHSLRSIIDESGVYICNDDCESVGKYLLPYINNDVGKIHIDTSSYSFKREFLLKTAHYWHFGYGGDRHYLQNVILDASRSPLSSQDKLSFFDCTKKYTLRYRLDGNPNSVKKEFFIQNNEIIRKMTPNGMKLPWNE